MDDLSVDELRALVRRRRSAVTAKIARTRRVNKAEVSGTSYDPRRDNGVVKRYNKRQLQAAVREYDKFLARGTQFYGDAEGRPITRQKWMQYKAAERQLNDASEQRRQKFDNVDLPGKNQTYKQHRAATKADFPTMADPAVNDPYPTYNRASTNISSVKQLDKLIQGMKRRARPKGYDQPLRDARAILKQMFDLTGASEMQKTINKLNKRQFEYLWNVSGFAEAKSTWYHLSKRAKEGHQQDWLDDVGHAMMEDAESYVEQAKKIK